MFSHYKKVNLYIAIYHKPIKYAQTKYCTGSLMNILEMYY